MFIILAHHTTLIRISSLLIAALQKVLMWTVVWKSSLKRISLVVFMFCKLVRLLSVFVWMQRTIARTLLCINQRVSVICIVLDFLTTRFTYLHRVLRKWVSFWTVQFRLQIFNFHILLLKHFVFFPIFFLQSLWL